MDAMRPSVNIIDLREGISLLFWLLPPFLGLLGVFFLTRTWRQCLGFWCLLAMIFMLMIGSAGAHDWYPKDCCSGNDCEPIACDSIAETSTGFLWRGLTFTREKVRASPNAKCHVCYGKDRFRDNKPVNPYCIFILPST